MCVGTANRMTFLEMAYVPSLHDTLVMFINTGWPLHGDPGNKTPIQWILGFIAMDPVG